MEHVLPGCGTIGEGELDAFATEVGSPDRAGEALPDAEHLPTIGFVEVGQAGGVGFRDDQ